MKSAPAESGIDNLMQTITLHRSAILSQPAEQGMAVRLAHEWEFHDGYVDRRPYYVFDLPIHDERRDAYVLALMYDAIKHHCDITVLQKLKGFNAKEYREKTGCQSVELVVNHLILASRDALFARDWELCLAQQAESFQPGIRDRYFERSRAENFASARLNRNRERVQKLLGGVL